MAKKKVVKQQKVSENKKEDSDKESSKKCGISKVNYWMVASIFLALVLLIVVFVPSFGSISKDGAAKKVVKLAEMSGLELTVLKVEDLKGFYAVEYSIEGMDGVIHISKDGKYVGQMDLFPEESDFDDSVTGAVVQDTPQDIPKSDKPVVDLFIMTHCPYGTQAEKGFIPMLDAMSKNVDGKIRFVHYFMHGDVEEQETYRQLCIREEQSEKYLDYLKCFLEGDGVVNPQYGLIMDGNDPSECMKRVGVNEAKVSSCVSSGKGKGYFEEDSTLSLAYGVQGSPTLVVNGVVASSGRSPSAYLYTVCDAFNSAPGECDNLSLSYDTPEPYFGWEGSSSYGSDGLC